MSDHRESRPVTVALPSAHTPDTPAPAQTTPSHVVPESSALPDRSLPRCHGKSPPMAQGLYPTPSDKAQTTPPPWRQHQSLASAPPSPQAAPVRHCVAQPDTETTPDLEYPMSPRPGSARHSFVRTLAQAACWVLSPLAPPHSSRNLPPPLVRVSSQENHHARQSPPRSPDTAPASAASSNAFNSRRFKA